MTVRQMLFLSCALLAAYAYADKNHVSVINDPETKEECGGCHFAFPSTMLPTTSWLEIMQNLDNHFGEDASLDIRTNQHITNYLTSSPERSEDPIFGFTDGIQDKKSPIRITETPYWIGKHFHISEEQLESGLAGLKARCTVCHLRAESGIFKYE